MAEEAKNVPVYDAQKQATEESSTEVKDRGLFGLLKKEEEKPQETIESEFEHKAQISEPAPEKEEDKKPSLPEKLHRTGSSSSSSSDEEDENGEKKKKEKKKMSEGEVEVKTEEEKKSFMEKLKEKLPGHGKKPEETSAVAPPVTTEEAHPVEKKGILEKIKEKLPGYHSKALEEEKKEKE